MKMPLEDLIDRSGENLREKTAMLDYLCHQIELYSNICIGRQNDAINYLSQSVSLKTTMTFILNDKVPDKLRAAFCQLLSYLYIDRQPRERININLGTISWNDIPEKTNKKDGKNAYQNEFEVAQKFINQYLQNLASSEPLFREMVCNLKLFKIIVSSRK